MAFSFAKNNSKCPTLQLSTLGLVDGHHLVEEPLVERGVGVVARPGELLVDEGPGQAPVGLAVGPDGRVEQQLVEDVLLGPGALKFVHVEN